MSVLNFNVVFLICIDSRLCDNELIAHAHCAGTEALFVSLKNAADFILSF